ncbi:hypothetical protein [Acinetobacter phage ABPH49]|nr:hypothetical protein [Acinetobacter phage ABPH49]
MEIKELLFEVAIRAAGVSKKLWEALYEREYKERPCPYLMINGQNVSPREWMIHCSEGLMKPIFGNTVFGDALRKKLEALEEENAGKELVIVLSDGGFVAEAIPNMDFVGVHNYYLARVQRVDENGDPSKYGFGADSRRFLYASDFGFAIRAVDWENRPNELEQLAEEIYADAMANKKSSWEQP